MERPKSVTVIAWIIIITSIVAIPMFLVNLNDPKFKEALSKQTFPMSILYIQLGIEVLVRLASGIGMLKAQDWSRYLYLTWGLLGLILATFTFSYKTAVIPSIIVLGLIAFFLYRPAANQYFTQK